jgi:hypothetical protein
MNRIIALAVAFAAIAIATGPEASAQTFNKSFQFGAGVRAAGGFGHQRGFNNGFGFGFVNRGVERVVRPPYFAEFPPVYYNGIVRRPYGISPYAAPAGVTPVELQMGTITVDPVTVTNPFFERTQPALETGIVDEQLDAGLQNKSTRVANPHFNAVPETTGPTRHASYEVLESN